MSSWIRCICGNNIHKNLFAGASVSVVCLDSDIDQVSDERKAEDAIHYLIQKGELLVKCDKCGRLAIEQKDGRINFYILENE
jgi:hypothetical protein